MTVEENIDNLVQAEKALLEEKEKANKVEKENLIEIINNTIDQLDSIISKYSELQSLPDSVIQAIRLKSEFEMRLNMLSPPTMQPGIGLPPAPLIYATGTGIA